MPAGEGAFVSLAEMLRPHAPSTAEAPRAEPVPAAATPPQPVPEYADVLRDIRLFRARLADALEAACAALEPAGGPAGARLGAALAAVLEALR